MVRGKVGLVGSGGHHGNIGNCLTQEFVHLSEVMTVVGLPKRRWECSWEVVAIDKCRTSRGIK